MYAADEMNVCGLVIRPHEHVVLAHGIAVDLTSREFEIMMRLATHPGWVFSAGQLSEDSAAGDFSPESVSVHVARLRHKLAVMGAADVVETVRGVGYRLRVATTGAEGESGAGCGVSRALRDAVWQLQEAVHEVEHSGGPEQQAAAINALETARRMVYASLAE